jgi:hypothetical protein
MTTPLAICALVLALLAVVFFRTGVGAVRQRRWLGGLLAGLIAALGFSLAALAATLSIGVQGYRALTLEQIAAKVKLEPTGPRRFRATVTLADSAVHMFDLAGDAVYVDAHILKWHPIVNLLGLGTAYELDRIAGRYDTMQDERDGPRTVHSLAGAKLVDAFDLARRYRVLAPLVDAEYGSATFIGAHVPAEYEVRVSTTGLLIRRAAKQ